jgi:hypothetical protein
VGSFEIEKVSTRVSAPSYRFHSYPRSKILFPSQETKTAFTDIDSDSNTPMLLKADPENETVGTRDEVIITV